MTDPILQEINAMHNAEDNQAALDVRIDNATTQKLPEITAGELMEALTNVDVGDVDQGSFNYASAEDYFDDLLSQIRQPEDGSDEAFIKIGKAVERLVFINFREAEVEPDFDE